MVIYMTLLITNNYFYYIYNLKDMIHYIIGNYLFIHSFLYLYIFLFIYYLLNN